ncbi:hypothetical protein LHP98_04380 [Rhodobacter sp. Har01]|uniref:hypothetical protein n=1 Tax=Rhodobacter sp. Har01 TaxID=2883999 RepID=UPI001D087C62|nr:hypothetical protein [Rhodobacter sp. Har01]MCB6177365.1 hypothetical protein [Rhodobacter sp. Har01]
MRRFVSCLACLLVGGLGAATRSAAEDLVFTSYSEARAYGLVLTAPASGCPALRYKLVGALGAVLGRSPLLSPGEIAVVRIGRGFPEGANSLKIVTQGCAASPRAALVPLAVRRIAVGKASPDHGWRGGALQ